MSPGQRHEPDVALEASDIDIGNVDVTSQVHAIDADLDKVTQSKSHTHTTSGTAESITGDAAFTAGATLMIIGIDTWVAVGDDAAQAQGGDVKFGAVTGGALSLTSLATTTILRSRLRWRCWGGLAIKRLLLCHLTGLPVADTP